MVAVDPAWVFANRRASVRKSQASRLRPPPDPPALGCPSRLLRAIGRRLGSGPVLRRAGSPPPGRNAIRCATDPIPQYRRRIGRYTRERLSIRIVRHTILAIFPISIPSVAPLDDRGRARQSVPVRLRYFGNPLYHSIDSISRAISGIAALPICLTKVPGASPRRAVTTPELFRRVRLFFARLSGL